MSSSGPVAQWPSGPAQQRTVPCRMHSSSSRVLLPTSLTVPCLVLQYDITKEHIVVLIDADKAMLDSLAEGVSGWGPGGWGACMALGHGPNGSVENDHAKVKQT